MERIRSDFRCFCTNPHTHTHTCKRIISTFSGPTPNLLGLCLCFSPVLNHTTIIHFLKFVIVAPVARMCIELAVNYRVIKKVSVHLTITVPKKNPTQNYSILNSFITDCIRNVDHAVLNTVFENTIRRVNKCLETGGGHFEHYW
jgi:hypothetical protein